jgi:hypothetical protein
MIDLGFTQVSDEVWFWWIGYCGIRWSQFPGNSVSFTMSGDASKLTITSPLGPEVRDVYITNQFQTTFAQGGGGGVGE